MAQRVDIGEDVDIGIIDRVLLDRGLDFGFDFDALCPPFLSALGAGLGNIPSTYPAEDCDQEEFDDEEETGPAVPLEPEGPQNEKEQTATKEHEDAVASSAKKRPREESVDEDETGPAAPSVLESPPKKEKPAFVNGSEVVLTRNGVPFCKTCVVVLDDIEYLLLKDVKEKRQGPHIAGNFETRLKYGVISGGKRAGQWEERVKYALKSRSFREMLRKAGLQNSLSRLLKESTFAAECSALKPKKLFVECLNKWDDSVRGKVREALGLRGTEGKQGELVVLDPNNEALKMEAGDFDQYEDWVRQVENSEVYIATMKLANCLPERQFAQPAARAYFKEVAKTMDSQTAFEQWINCENLKELVKQEWFYGYLRTGHEANVLVEEMEKRHEKGCEQLFAMRFSNKEKGRIAVILPKKLSDDPNDFSDASAAKTWNPLDESSIPEPENAKGFPFKASPKLNHYK